MILIHPDDQEALTKLVGPDIPLAIAEEYGIRLSLCHRAGRTGALGVEMLIDLVRFRGVTATPQEAPTDRILWRAYPQDGSTRVEARFGGAWRPGAFEGFVDGTTGTLAIRFDDEPDRVVECRQGIVRLVVPGKQPDHDVAAETEPTPAIPQPPAPESVPPVEYVPPGPRDWTKVTAGTRVWVDVNDAIRDGKFEGILDEKTLVVHVDGAPEAEMIAADQVEVAS